VTKAMEKGQEISGKGGKEWIDLAQNKDMWGEFLNAVMNIWVP
jgi:hypothetical protein